VTNEKGVHWAVELSGYRSDRDIWRTRSLMPRAWLTLWTSWINRQGNAAEDILLGTEDARMDTPRMRPCSQRPSCRAFYVTVRYSERRTGTMQHENISDAEIDSWLKTLGITSLCQWDVLVFLYHHQTSLVGANLIAHLLGYASDPVVAALDVLAFLGLVERSRVSQVARLYQFTVPSDPQRCEAWIGLLPLASHRVGRVRLAQRLRGGDQTAQEERDETRRLLSRAQQTVAASRQGLQETRRYLAEVLQSLQASRPLLQLHSGGQDTWRKAI
jgi:hypothetical protein